MKPGAFLEVSVECSTTKYLDFEEFLQQKVTGFSSNPTTRFFEDFPEISIQILCRLRQWNYSVTHVRSVFCILMTHDS